MESSEQPIVEGLLRFMNDDDDDYEGEDVTGVLKFKENHDDQQEKQNNRNDTTLTSLQTQHNFDNNENGGDDFDVKSKENSSHLFLDPQDSQNENVPLSVMSPSQSSSSSLSNEVLNTTMSTSSPSVSDINNNTRNPQQIMFETSKIAKRKSLEYLKELFHDRERISMLPLGMFVHLGRLIDQEILRVRASLIHIDGSAEQRQPLRLPEAIGPVVQRTARINLPSDKYPEYNFVGRIIGPRGLTIRELEVDCECKLYIRGRGSLRNKEKEEKCRGQPNWEHLNDDLHVMIVVEDSENRAQAKLQYASEQINKLIESVILQKDDFKMRQLAELAILNDRFNPTKLNQSQNHNSQQNQSNKNGQHHKTENIHHQRPHRSTNHIQGITPLSPVKPINGTPTGSATSTILDAMAAAAAASSIFNPASLLSTPTSATAASTTPYIGTFPSTTDLFQQQQSELLAAQTQQMAMWWGVTPTPSTAHFSAGPGGLGVIPTSAFLGAGLMSGSATTTTAASGPLQNQRYHPYGKKK